jgi:hypothetical protein
MKDILKFLTGLFACIEVLEKQDIAKIIKMISTKETKTDRISFDFKDWIVTFKKKPRSKQK